MEVSTCGARLATRCSTRRDRGPGAPGPHFPSPCASRDPPGPSSRASRPPRAWPCGGPRWKRSSKHRTRLWDEGHYRDPDTGYPLPTWEQALDRSGWPLRPPSASRVRSRLLKVALGQVPLHGDPVPVDVLTATGCDSRCVRAALASASVRKPPTQRRLLRRCEQTRYQTGSTWIQAPGRTPLTCGRGSPGRNRTYVACPDSKSGGPCQQTNRGTPPKGTAARVANRHSRHRLARTPSPPDENRRLRRSRCPSCVSKRPTT